MRDIDNGSIPDDVIAYWDMGAFLKAEQDGFPRLLNPDIGSVWWQADGRHYIDRGMVERYVPLEATR